MGLNSNFVGIVKKNKKILISSYIHSDINILKHFILWLSKLDIGEFIVDYYFANNNDNMDTCNLLNKFNNVIDSVTIEDVYTDSTHEKNVTNIRLDYEFNKYIQFKNKIINYAIYNKYDYIYFISDDIILHPLTLRQLVYSNKPIITSLIWKNDIPNCVGAMSKKFASKLGYSKFHPDDDYDIEDYKTFKESLKVPLVYNVSYISKSVLFSKNAFSSGINFNSIYNVNYANDYHAMSIRAKILGYDLFLDSKYPSFVISDSTDLIKMDKLNRENNF